TMHRLGEPMPRGRNRTEALRKAMRSPDVRGSSFEFTQPVPYPHGTAAPLEQVRALTHRRLRQLTQAIRAGAEPDARPAATPRSPPQMMQAIAGGAAPEDLCAATWFDPWYTDQLLLLHEVAEEIRQVPALSERILTRAKRHGFSDAQIAGIRGLGQDTVRELRHAYGLRPVYKTVDTCAAEFAARTPYHYSSYDSETEVGPRERPAVLIIGSGPNRIGQGIEFDYSCVHAALGLKDRYETVMVNCNPETVSTDYDTADRLYFEPLTF